LTHTVVQLSFSSVCCVVVKLHKWRRRLFLLRF